MADKNLIFTTNTSVDIFEIGEDIILVEGVLKDERLYPSYHYLLNKHLAPGIIHKIVLKLTISLHDLSIISATLEIPHAPDEVCREIRHYAYKLTGLKIGKGFRKKVVEVMGAENGCAHLTNLILAMASPIIQGRMAYYSIKREKPGSVIPKFDTSLFLNTCRLWKDDGVYQERIKELEEGKDTDQ